MADKQTELIGDTTPVPRKARAVAVQHEEPSPEGLIAQAIAAGQSVETIEKLLLMRRELKAEWAREQFFSALSTFQAEMPPVAKTKKVLDKNGKHRYSYAPLDEIIATVKPLLQRHGFSYTMKPVQDEAGSFTATIIAHHRDGHEEQTSFAVPIDTDAYMNAPQRVGSARTFAMRYAFCNAFGILTSDEDDDAGQFAVDDLLAAQSEIERLKEAKDAKALLAEMQSIWKGLPENDARRPIVRKYYEQRKAELMEEGA